MHFQIETNRLVLEDSELGHHFVHYHFNNENDVDLHLWKYRMVFFTVELIKKNCFWLCFQWPMNLEEAV